MEQRKIIIGRESMRARFGFSKHTFYELLRAGVPVFRLGPNGILVFHADEVERWIAEQCKPGKSPPAAKNSET